MDDRDSPLARCPNCDAGRAGEYCYQCGQHFIDGRPTLALFAHEALARVDVDRGILRTIGEMTRDPGGVIRRYVAGQRARYVNPLAYLFFGAAVSLLSYQLYDDAVGQWARDLMQTPADDTPLLSREERLLYAELLISIGQQAAYVALASSLPFAVVLRWLFRRSGINLAEALIFTLFAMGHGMVASAVAVPLLWVATGNMGIAASAGLLPVVWIVGHSAAGFFGRSTGVILKSTVAYVVSYLLTIMSLSAGIMLYVLSMRR